VLSAEQVYGLVIYETVAGQQAVNTEVDEATALEAVTRQQPVRI
jgi:hypothetical protein